jgi:hypothetical protein
MTNPFLTCHLVSTFDSNKTLLLPEPVDGEREVRRSDVTAEAPAAERSEVAARELHRQSGNS